MCVLMYNGIFLSLQNVPQNLNLNDKHQYDQKSKPGFKYIVKLHTSRGGVNQMGILKKSKDLFNYHLSKTLSPSNSINAFDFSTLNTSNPHSKLKNKLKKLILLCCIKMNGQGRYKYLVLRRDTSCIVRKSLSFKQQFFLI